jgi:hypothetical protein
MLLALPMVLAPLATDGARTPSIRAVMHKQYTVSRSPFKAIKKELDAPSPDWEKVREAAERFGALAADLPKNTPLRGSPESWRLLVGRHLDDARAMRDAAEARDPETLRAAHRRVADSCNACHQAHRPREGG